MNKFEKTMSILETRLNSRLRPDYRKLRVEGCHKSGKTSFCFIIFGDGFPRNYGGYTLEFYETKNLRMWREDGDIAVENSYMDKIITDIVNSKLSNYVS